MLKRAFDISVALTILLLGAPLWLLIALAIKVDSRGPLVYRAPRVGLGGRVFTMYKLRSMTVDARERGPAFTLPDDPRVIRVGHLLRALKLDEMPQLFNILKGDMSIVGPRPEDPRYVEHYTPAQRRVFSVRPGLTNPAMIKYRHEQELLAAAGGDPVQTYLTVHLPDRLSMDLDYIDRQSFRYDLLVVAQAFRSLFRRRDHAPVQATSIDPGVRRNA